jgi:hypothetical protein
MSKKHISLFGQVLYDLIFQPCVTPIRMVKAFWTAKDEAVIFYPLHDDASGL